MWSQMTPDTSKYKPGQIAAYAHQMARHAALRLRRELGSSVRLPGSAFRKRKDGTSYVTPGVLASALDWSEMEGWFQTEDSPEGGPPGGTGGGFGISTFEEEIVSEDDADTALRNSRLDSLLSNADVLTERQKAIVSSLVDGASYEDVMLDLNIKKGVLMRELTIAGSVLGLVDL